MRNIFPLWRVEARLHSIAPRFSLACIGLFAALFVSYTIKVAVNREQAAMCLAENVYHEARGESSEAKYVLGMLTLARVSDPDPQWPKTICGTVGQDKAFSWVLEYKLATERSEQQKWEEAKSIARDLIANAWTSYALPRGWECARWFKRTEVSRPSKQFFETKLFPVGSFGRHTAFQERHGCRYRLPTV
jgi:hypothetical protein